MAKEQPSTSPISVVIIDDHPVVRAGLRTALEATPGIIVCAEGCTGEGALQQVNQHRPDVVVLDVNLPDIDGIEVTRRLKATNTNTAILILTVHDDRQTIFGLLENGVAGYVLKDEALETLPTAVQAVARGEKWLSPAVTQQVIARATGQEQKEPPAQDADTLPLTPRETEVLQLLAHGLDNATIAERLVITKRTVQNHVSNIYAKLEVNTRTAAALYAIRHGLVQVSSPPDEDTGDGP